MGAWDYSATRLRAGDARADGAQREIILARENVLIRRRVSGVDMRVDVPARAYRGVVLSMCETAAGAAFYRISLWHRDPELAVTLQEAADDRDVVADWRSWARFFRLPELVERAPGRIESAQPTLGAVSLGRGAQLRRRGAALSKRRPRLLMRRKPGDLARHRRVIADERVIICYE